MRSFISIVMGIVAITGFVLLNLPEPVVTERTTNSDSDSNLQTWRFLNATWFDGQRWQSGELLIENGQVVDAIKGSANELDVAGRYIIPGLIDAHTHTWGDALRQALQFGVTTELDMFTQPNVVQQARRQRDRLTATTEADLFSSGVLATSPRGHGTEYGLKIPTLNSPSEALSFVRQRHQEGSDYLKIVYHHQPNYGPYTSIDRATLKALIQAAHHEGMMAVVHASHLEAARHAVEDGADGLVHMISDQPIDTAFIELIKQKNTFIVPTLTVIAAMAQQSSTEFLLPESYVGSVLSTSQKHQLKSTFDHAGHRQKALTIAIENTRKLSQAGIDILSGTDAPNPGTAHGISLHNELFLLQQAGLSNTQLLQTASSAANKRFNIGSRGLLTIGSRADLLILSLDPRENIQHTQAISMIMKNGFWVNLTSTSNATSTLPVYDFTEISAEDFSLTPTIKFSATSDQMFSGHSIAHLKVSPSTCSNTPALVIDGEIKDGFPYPWSGLMLPFSQNMASAYSLNNHSHLLFNSQGTPGQFRLLIFVQGKSQPEEIRFKVTAECQAHRIKLADHQQIDWQSVTALAWVAGKQQSKFTLSLDSIKLIQ
ncbi:amidohydrolase family protein [Pleionea litopenaei]|uniref:Amidohydrolase family protein n=1 Tax=Pleionea litopenaei TaxID=3070815 RepID=A0AA51RRM9_9GAMM|nr:amidohydrolase family protein [Pleionea sp. HL-JVS1]WMS86297.1 amidohydrolase family protein [Pleionea sp. HL-JVS1]